MKIMTFFTFASVCLSVIVAKSEPIVSDVILGRIRVDSGTRSTILSLPYTLLGGDAAQVPPDKVVLSDNLVDGTSLFSEINAVTYAWELRDGVWQSIAVVNQFESNTDDSAGIPSLARGVTFWIERAGTAEDIRKPFYIFGKVGADIESTQTIAGAPGTTDKDGNPVPSYTRIGNPNPTDLDLNSLSWTGCGDKDEIVISDSASATGHITFTRKNNQWGIAVTRPRRSFDTDRKIPAGQGFWYVRKATGNATVTISVP